MSEHWLAGIIIIEFAIAVVIVGGVARAIWTDEHRYLLLPRSMWKKYQTQP